MAALISSFYIFSVFFISILTYFSYEKPIEKHVFGNKLRRLLPLIEVLCSGVTESSVHLILLKLIHIKIVNLFGGFKYSFVRITYWIDILNIIALGYLFYDMLQEKPVFDKMMQSIKKDSPPIQTMMSYEHFKKLINPAWRPKNIKIHPNITYATNEEIREALETTQQDFSQPRKMMLDVFTSSEKSSDLRPVLVHIHGGAWMMGSKNVFYPHEKLLIQDQNWVIVNIGYRLSPKNAYPTHLIDVKRAIRWIKKNISSFGGDPNFIVLSGDSAGGHLAAMTSLTTNESKYQPGFETVDTSVRGVISLAGAINLTSDPARAEFFSKRISKLDKIDLEFLQQHSPTSLVSTIKDKSKLVPFLLIAGERDALVESDSSISFKKAYDQVAGHDISCKLLLIPHGHHISYIAWSPRSLYNARVIQAWCEQLYHKQ